MLRPLQSVALASALGGCSLIYNPNNLPDSPDEAGVKHDAEVILDADPSKISLTSVAPAAIDEGAGVGGSRPALLNVTGTQIVPGAQVSVARSDGMATTAVVDNTQATVADDGFMITVPVTIGIDTDLGPSKTHHAYTLDVTVTNPGGFKETVAGMVTVTGYDELDTVPLISGTYSRVKFAGNYMAPTGADPVVIHSTSNIVLTSGTYSVDASGRTGGPAGGTGGANSLGGDAGTGPSPGKGAGGGGSFGTAGGAGTNGASTPVGDAALHRLTAPNRSSGGAGGSNGIGTGGVGGGGGGSLELTAAGDLTVDKVTSLGGNATAHGGGLGPTDGGGGSGGAILLRTGGKLVQTSVLVTGGTTPGTSAGKGGEGRVRFDAAVAGDTLAGPTSVYRGPQFLAGTPLIVRDKAPTITVTCQSNEKFNYYIYDERLNVIEPDAQPTCGLGGTADLDLSARGTPLGRGVNQFCLLVLGGVRTPVNEEDRNCINIAFLYKQ